jgi:hypothetical protein
VLDGDRRLGVTIRPESLRDVRTLDHVLALLSDELDWPIGNDDLETVTFDYDLAELGIPADELPTVTSLRQMRPATAAQPWGVFFIEFSGARLPLTALRRLLQRLVAKKRASASPAARRTWELDDLLFITTTDAGESVELHFIAFFENPGRAPEVRSLPWRPLQSPLQHLRRLAGELLPRLSWPTDEDAADAWRASWRDAFRLRHGAAIASAAMLADRMADTALVLWEQLADALEAEKEAGPLTDLLGDVRRDLVHNVSPEEFADMCAQTLVYGALASRIADPDAFGASPVLNVVPLTNPFLASFFERVHDQAVDLGAPDSGFEQLVADMRVTNVEAILDQFGSTAKGGDPVIHFYEEFLKQYDPDLRKDAGAFYTPQPVVAFIARSVDAVLRDRLGLADGAADASTWRDVAGRLGIDVPTGTDPDQPFVAMLDPATGTGTFLVEWLRAARSSFLLHHGEDEWREALRDHVLPSMHAFELMLAPYTIAHLKVALEVHGFGHGVVTSAIHLTDTLERAAAQQRLATMDDPLAAEGERAAELKENARFTVIVGNPPYDRIARDAGGGWIMEQRPGAKSLFDDILDPAREHTIFSHHASLYNLYVYFWRWALWKAFEDRGAGPAVVSFITASSWLTGPGFLGLRQLVRQLGDEVWVVDLGGDNKGARPEENVFDIETPVAIVTIFRTGAGDYTTPARVRYTRVFGTREEKLATLRGLDVTPTGEWADAPTGWLDAFVPPTGGAAWTAFPALIDLFPWQQPGCKVNRTWPIAPTHEVLQARWQRFLASETHAERARCFVTTSTGRSIDTSVAPFPRLADIPAGTPSRPIVAYGYRSFDHQRTFADPRLMALERPSLWASRTDVQVFMASMPTFRLGTGPAATVTTAVPDLHFFRGSFGGKDIIPLYRDAAGTPNVDPAALDAINTVHHTTDAHAAEVTAERLLVYVFGVLAGADYTTRFADELETPGPRVPLTAAPELFDRMCRLGERLLFLQTFGERFGAPGDLLPEFATIRWERNVTGIPETMRDVVYDESSCSLRVGDGRLVGVDPDVWAFEVSGMTVLKKWLGYRTRKGTGRAASSESPLDQIRHERWDDAWSEELVQLVTVLRSTLDLLPAGQVLLDEICAGPLVSATDLPAVPPALREVPPASWRDEALLRRLDGM